MKLKEFNWEAAPFLIIYQILLFVTLPLYIIFIGPNLGLIIVTIVLFILNGLAITAGYHRLYAHKTYKLHKIPEIILLFFGTMGAQSSVLRWAYDHRQHHWFVDTEKDPYSVKKGFWHAHFLWLMKKRPYDPNVVQDLQQNKLLVFQHKYYVLSLIVTNALMVLIFGLIFKDIIGAFVLVFLTRLFLSHHTTFFINSLAHTWGSQPYSKEHTAVNNWMISFLTFGEGYHNYHHTFANDYRNGVRWYQFDPTKTLILVLSWFKLATDMKKVDKYVIKRRLILEDSRILMDRVKEGSFLKKRVAELSTKLSSDLTNVRTMIKQYKVLKKNKIKNEQRVLLKFRIKQLKKRIKLDFKAWTRLYKNAISPQMYY